MSIICITQSDKEVRVASEGLVIDASSWEKMESDRHKIIQFDSGTIVGGVGTSLVIQMFLDFYSLYFRESEPATELGFCALLVEFKNYTKKTFSCDLDKDDTDFIIVTKYGKVFLCTCCGTSMPRVVLLQKSNFALGVGADYAKGAMDFGASAAEACEATANRFIGLNRNIVEYTVNVKSS